MTAADSVSVLLASGRSMRGVSNLVTLDPDDGEPWGLNSKGDPAAGRMFRVSLRRAIEQEFKKHVHLVCYYIEDADGLFDRAPRLTKEALAQVREEGADVKMWGVCIDWDLKDHPPLRSKSKVGWDDLSSDQRAEARAALTDGGALVEEAGFPWNVFYTTKHGARFVHVFAEAMPAGSNFEKVAFKIRKAYVDADLIVDESCKDWTRLFAVPCCTHDDGTQTWDHGWFEVEEQWEDFYVPDEEAYDQDSEPVLRVRKVDTDRPDPDQAQALVEFLNSTNNQYQLTKTAKLAKKELKQEPVAACFDAIFNSAPLADEGNRHTTLLESVGQVATRLYGYQWATPELVYALLRRAAEAMGHDDDGTEFVDKLWEMTCSIWAKEEAKASARRVEKEAAHEEKRKAPEGHEDAFAQGVKQWLPDVEDFPSSSIVERVRQARLGVVFDQKRDNYHVLLPSGYYDAYPCSLSSLPKVVAERGMEWLVPVSVLRDNDKGEPVDVPLRPDTIRDRSARTFAYTEFSLRKGGSHVTVDDQGRGVFRMVPFALRSDLEPWKFDEVYKWLSLLAGEDDASRLRRALACMLAIEHGPTAAVSLVGPSGTGKSMLGIGLGECFNTKRVVPGDVLTAKHNDAMLWSPIVHVDEGISRGSSGIDFADSFRRIVTGGAFAIEPKGMPMIRMVGAHRVLMTANNLDTINRLGGGQARTADDWHALSERIATFRADDAAAEYLAGGDGKNKGYDWTKTWVGEGSEYRLARTMLWIYHNELQWVDGHPVREGRRMLFEGNTDSDLMRDLEAEACGVPEVVRTINMALNRSDGKYPAAALLDGRVYVMAEKIVQIGSETSPQKAPELRNAMRSLLLTDQPQGRLTIKGRQGRWKAIDLERFLELLDRLGEVPSRVFSAKKETEKEEVE